MKYPGLIVIMVCLVINVFAQKKVAGQYHRGHGSVEAKNYYLLTLLQQNNKVRWQLAHDPQLVQIAVKQNTAIKKSLADRAHPLRLTGVLKLGQDQIDAAGVRLKAMYHSSSQLRSLVKNELIPSGAYIRYKDLRPAELLVKAWEQDAAGIDHTLAVYAEGAKPNYPDIDSISFDVRSPQYKDTIRQFVQNILAETGNSRLFFMRPMSAALEFLKLNGRNDAGAYEPMESTVNSAALAKMKTTNWNKYQYTVILVPGEGPDSSQTPISSGSILRCKLAAAAHRQGLAPFIMVSGGKVHPYKTRYCEAEEMKNYLVKVLHIPFDAILLEPHARHTTTNMRNAVRLMIQNHFPLIQPAVVISDASQSAYITGMFARCIKELGHVPYRLGNRISVSAQEFYAVRDALQINADEPLDP